MELMESLGRMPGMAADLWRPLWVGSRSSTRGPPLREGEIGERVSGEAW